VTGNLPAPLTPLVGRARELERIGATLQRTRLVTLTGPGGVGKTRLAVALAERQALRRSAGVWLVDLTPTPEAGDVAAEVARVLGVERGALRPYLRDRDPLLVLDNCEHVIDACAELAADLLGACRSVRVLATSRESLGVPGETVWRLEPLSAEDARRLFVERARQRRPDLVPAPEADAAIAQLCERLDRLPLAIELAAARVDMMSPAELLASLDAGVLGAGTHRRPERHRTVRAAIEWSHRLLEPAEQAGFRRRAGFVGGFDAAAAAAVVPELSVDLLARLVDKSLVVASESPRGRTRFRLLETLRQYAAEQLAAAGEDASARDAHLRHFAALADRSLDEWLTTGRQWFVNQLDDDYENVRAALERAVVADPCRGVRAVAGARDLFYRFGQAEGCHLAARLLERCPARTADRAAALMTAGHLAAATGDLAAARRWLAQARALAGELAEPGLEAWIRWFEGLTEILAGRPEAAREPLRTSRELHRRLGVRIGEARALAGLAGTYLFAGDAPRSRELHEAALAIYREEGDRWGQGQCHALLGVGEADGPDPRRATAHFRTAAELLRPYRDATLLPVALVGQAGVLARRDPARAIEVLAAAAAMRERVGGDFQPVFRPLVQRTRATAERRLDAAQVERLWAKGARLALDGAIALAFGSSPPRREDGSGLSAREVEVAGLVADGLTNKAIALRLHLSVRTVEVHVRHALGKLGLDNRTQLAGWAREHGA
jgi:predicted ATPase/DNA-binding CsgD family transcriptional regulator